MQILTSKVRFKEYKIFTNIISLNIQIFCIILWFFLYFYISNKNVINDLNIDIVKNTFLTSNFLNKYDNNFQIIISESNSNNIKNEVSKIIISEAYNLDNIFIAFENFLIKNFPVVSKI